MGENQDKKVYQKDQFSTLMFSLRSRKAHKIKREHKGRIEREKARI